MTNRSETTLPDPRDLLSEVAEAVLIAGSLLRAEAHRPAGPRKLGSFKAPIDDEIEAFLKERLLRLHPCDWWGEETPRRLSDHRDAWAVDPQDGTRAFLRGLRGSSVSVALVRDGVPVLGIVYAPLAPTDDGDFFAWAEGLPATRNGEVLGAIGNDAPAFSFDPDAETPSMWPLPKPEARGYGVDTVLALNDQAGNHARHNHVAFRPARVRAVPSIAWRLALAAAGEVDAALSLTSGLCDYDIAGGHAILRGVGGVLTELGGEPILYSGGRSFNGCIGGPEAIVAEVAQRRPVFSHEKSRHAARPARLCPSSGMLDRAQGVLMGLLAGDALGSAVEFRSTSEILRLYPDGVRDLADGGTWNTFAGQPTDDGEMALSLARCLVAEERFDTDAVGRAYVGWGASRPFDMGGTTAAGLASLAGRGRRNTDSQSNGALMRVAPIGIFAAGRPELAARLAREDAALTHPHPVCVAASGAYAAAVAGAVGGAPRPTVWALAHANSGKGEGGQAVRRALMHAFGSDPFDMMRNMGWVIHAFTNAFRALAMDAPLERALTGTVRFGGDTDTNAAICGALIGAVQGRSGLPQRWQRAILTCRAVDAPGIAHPRPVPFWPDDAPDLAEALLAAGA